MKRYNELTDQEQEQAVEKSLTALLTCIVEGAIRFSDEDLQGRIDGAMQEADRMQTPWFAIEYVVAAVGEELRGMARADAEEAYYTEPGEVCYTGIVHQAA